VSGTSAVNRTAPTDAAGVEFEVDGPSVDGTHERVMVTRNGVPAAVLISPAELESIEATLEVLYVVFYDVVDRAVSVLRIEHRRTVYDGPLPD